MLQAVEKKSLADAVFDQLVGEIVTGGYAPGAEVPAERELSETLGVNRHVVREALKRLQQIGLVKVVQGGRTTVLDLRRSAGLDLLALVAEHAGVTRGAGPLLEAVMEMRAGIGVDVVRLCAERAGPRIGRELIETSARLEQIGAGPELLELDESYWRAVLDGAGNLAYQLAFNSLIRAVHAHIDVSLPMLERELADGGFRAPISAAIAAGDVEAAVAAARAGLAPREQPHPARRGRAR